MLFMKKVSLFFCMILFSFYSNASTSVNATIPKIKTAILVPGFFNSIVPSFYSQSDDPWKFPYFTNSLSIELSHKNYRVFVVNNLDPLGTVNENSIRLVQYLRSVKSYFPDTDEMTLISHSAGGLYSLYAAQFSDLKINKIVAISTPFKGAELSDDLTLLTLMLPLHLGGINSDGIESLSNLNVQYFLNSLHWNHSFELQIYMGYQTEGLRVWDADQLSPLLMLTQSLIGKKSDGIVSIESAFGITDFIKQYNLKSNLGIKLRMNSDLVPLDHWEQVIDPEMFLLLGTTNIELIRERQNIFFKRLVEGL